MKQHSSAGRSPVSRPLRRAGIVLAFACAAALGWSSPAAPAALSAGGGDLAPTNAPPAPGYESGPQVLAAIGRGEIKLVKTPEEMPPGVVEESNLEYGSPGGRSLRLDLFHPASVAKPVPGLIFIHGGAWSGGDRKMLRVYGMSYARKGYVTACISYRLSGEATSPAAIQDCKCAVRWLRDNAGKYHVNPDQIGVIGGSAGGHLAMMLGYASDPSLEGDGGHTGVSSKVQAVVNFYGVYDMTTPACRVAGPVVKFVGGKSYAEAPELYTRVSPVHYLAKGAPPTLILHGTIDDLVPISQSDALADRLRELGVPFVYDRLPGWPHAMDMAEVVNQRCQFMMDAFFARHLPLPR